MSDCRHKFSQEVVRQPEVEFCDYCGLQQPIANHPASPTERIRDLEAQLRAAQQERDKLQQAIDEGHGRLTAAGIPHANWVACDDPSCQSKIGHRIKELIAREATVRLLDEAIAHLRQLWHRLDSGHFTDGIERATDELTVLRDQPARSAGETTHGE